MLATSKDHNHIQSKNIKRLQKQVLNLEVQRYQDIIDYINLHIYIMNTFHKHHSYMHCTQKDKENSTFSMVKCTNTSPYDTSRNDSHKFCCRIECGSIFDNGCIFSIIPEQYYDKHYILHKCQKM